MALLKAPILQQKQSLNVLREARQYFMSSRVVCLAFTLWYADTWRGASSSGTGPMVFSIKSLPLTGVAPIMLLSISPETRWITWRQGGGGGGRPKVERAKLRESHSDFCSSIPSEIQDAGPHA